MNRGCRTALAAIGGALVLAGPAEAATCETKEKTIVMTVGKGEKASVRMLKGTWYVGAAACPRVVGTPVLRDGPGSAAQITIDMESLRHGGTRDGIRALTIDLGGRDDRVFVRGTKEPDVLTATSDAKAGDRVLFTAKRNPWLTIAQPLALLGLDGGESNDTLSGAVSPGTTYARSLALGGGPGNDRLAGGRSDDVLDGGPGADQLFGTLGSDVEAGGSGADVLTSSVTSERDVLDGGAGADTLTYEGHRAGVIAVMADALPKDGLSAKYADRREDAVSGMEAVIGSAFADRLVGSSLGERLSGGAGDDLLFGGNGDDALDGGAGLDRFDGGAGVNTCRVEPQEPAVGCTP